MMSRYYRRCRRLAVLAACVGSTTAVAALAGAGPAMASVKCDPGPLYASGSSFQNTAQSVFKTGWAGEHENAKLEKIKNSNCEGGPPSITYTATSSGEGLEVFGMGNVKGEKQGELLNKQDSLVKKLEEEAKACGPKNAGPPASCLDIFVGSDDGPTELPKNEQLGGATTASGGKSGNKGGEREHRAAVVIPVAQGPVAVMLSLPAGCKIQTGSKVDLTNVALGQLWEAKSAKGAKGAGDPGGIQAQGGYAAATWGAFLTQLGYTKVAKESELTATSFTETAPEETLTRYSASNEEEVEVRSLEEAEKGEGPKKVKVPHQEKVKVKGEGCTQEVKPNVRSSESGTTYAFKGYLNQINSTVWSSLWSDAATWPEEGGVVRENSSTSGNEKILNKKGSQLAEATSATPGEVGYADTADAFKGGGATETAASTNRPAPSAATLEEVVEEEVENKAKTGKVKIKTLKKLPVKSISHELLWAQVQNTGTGAATKSSEFVNPLQAGAAHLTNCETTSLVAGDEAFPKHWNDSWNGTITSDPSIAKVGATDYPVCAITYDVTWHHFQNSKLYGHTELAHEMANTAKDYFEYMSGVGKEELTASGFYTGPPAAMKGYIKAAVENIGY